MAAKGLSNLITLAKWTLEEKRRKLAELLRLAEQLNVQKQRLEQELEAEQEIAAASPENSLTYAGFARVIIERREKLETSIADVERQIAETREEVATSYRELKRHEMAKAMRERRDTEPAPETVPVAGDWTPPAHPRR